MTNADPTSMSLAGRASRHASPRQVLLLAAAMAALVPVAVRGQNVPGSMNYQGYITEEGTPLSGAYVLTFSVYNAETSGDAVWGPQIFDGVDIGDPGKAPQVQFVDGRFNVTLGEDILGKQIGEELARNSFPDGCWLEVKVGTHLPMARQQMLSAPFAFVAGDIKHDSLALTSAGAEVSGHVSASNGFSGFGIVPIGSIIPWHKSLPGMPALPDGWVECNGQTLDDGGSPLDGQTIPNLNGQGRFLRGGTTSGTFEADAMQKHGHLPGEINIGPSGDHKHPYTTWSADTGNYCIGINNFDVDPRTNCPDLNYVRGATHTHPKGSFQGHTGIPTKAEDSDPEAPRVDTETRPINMSVVWIMRVK
ncbi:MAG: tail fiber protein [Lentisphaeria bacterium]|nr:tail fiber protein [Lentisphaeria bacterium]